MMILMWRKKAEIRRQQFSIRVFFCFLYSDTADDEHGANIQEDDDRASAGWQ
jgi:hypothetical protein